MSLASAGDENKKSDGLIRVDSLGAFADGNEHELLTEKEIGARSQAGVSSIGSPKMNAVCPPPEKNFDAPKESSDFQTTDKQFSPPPEKTTFEMPRPRKNRPLPKSDSMSFVPDAIGSPKCVPVTVSPSPLESDDSRSFSNLGDLSKRQDKPMCKMGCGRPVADGISKFGWTKKYL